jgi:L-amino acid N-acyltransferase YncA
MWERLATYRNLLTLKDGTKVLLRPLVPDDAEKLADLFAKVSDEDLRYLRNNVRDQEVVKGWARNVNYSKVFPLVAVVNDRIVGDATLHLGTGPARHRAELRVYLSREFRGRGLGASMLKNLIELARRAGVQQLVAEIVADQLPIIRAFQDLGFQLRSIYDDYFMMPDGTTHDVAVLILRLVPRAYHKEEF